MSLSVTKQGDTVNIIVRGQLVVGNRQALKQRVLQAIDEGERKFLLDFGETGQVDSSGLGVLVSLAKKLREVGGEMHLANLNGDLKALFEVTKLHTVLPIHEEGKDA